MHAQRHKKNQLKLTIAAHSQSLLKEEVDAHLWSLFGMEGDGVMITMVFHWLPTQSDRLHRVMNDPHVLHTKSDRLIWKHHDFFPIGTNNALGTPKTTAREAVAMCAAGATGTLQP